MAISPLHIGTFAAIYVGVYGATSVLTQLSIETTANHVVEYGIPEVFNYAVQNMVQAGPPTIKASCTFLSDDPAVVKLANGNFITAAEQDTPSTFAKLVLLLIHPDDTADSSFLIPQCTAAKNYRFEGSKTSPTTTPLLFSWQDPDTASQIYYKRSADDLATILGPRSPI